MRNESFTLSFVYADIDPRSHQRIAVIQHIQKSYPVIAFLLASPVQAVEQASHDGYFIESALVASFGLLPDLQIYQDPGDLLKLTNTDFP